MLYTLKNLDKSIEDTRSMAAHDRAANPTRAAYEDGFADGQVSVYQTVEHMTARIAELEAALKTAARYLEHPEVQAIPFALPASSVAEHIEKLLKRGNQS